jgi:hypothetical protein
VIKISIRQNSFLVSEVVVLLLAGAATGQNTEYISSILWSGVSDIAVADGYAYCSFANGLVIYDVSNVDSLELVTQMYLPGRTGYLDVHDNYVFITRNTEGLKIIDITDRENPVITGSYETSSSIYHIDVAGEYAYIRENTSDLLILHISEPYNPTYVSYYYMYGSAEDVYVAGDYAYVAFSRQGYLILDISNVYNPVHVFNELTPGYCNNICASGENIFIADDYSFMILEFIQTNINEDNKLPDRYQLSQKYPNPFNASTTIKYELPSTTHVTIDIYDLLGRKVEMLIDGEQIAGIHHIVWQAEDVASGMYFYKITAGEYIETQQMILIK